MDYYIVLALGMIAQALFSARFIIQLTKSELAGKVMSPVIFWHLSLLASLLLMLYGFFRNDIVIIGGQMISYYVYIRNLQLKKEWQRLYLPLRYAFYLIPLVLVLSVLMFSFESVNGLLNNPEIPLFLLTYGSIGQVVFTFRFVVQWAYSEKKKASEFPPLFWIISLVGALLILGYAIMRNDAVLFIGQFFGLLVYTRNLYLHYMPQKRINTTSFSILAHLKRYRLLFLSVIAGFALFANLNDWTVTESTEARYAQISNEMKESGDYLHPTLMGIKHYHKPPLTYWITAASYKLFGTSGFSARFFLQIAIILQILIVYGIAKLLLKSKKLAFLSAILYFALPGVIMSSRTLTTDVYLTTFVLLSIYAWLRFALFKQQRYLFLFYLSLGLGFFTKGPVVFIFPLFIIIGGYLGGIKPPKRAASHILGFALMLVTGLGWFIYLYIQDQQFLDYFLIRHTVERFATDVFRRTEPWWYFLAIVPAASFPWGVMLITRLFRKKTFKSGVGILFFMWIVPPVLFFSMSSSKMLLYVLPVYAGIAIAAIWAWGRMPIKQKKIWENIQFIFHMTFLVALALVPLVTSDIHLSKHVFFLLIMTFSVLIVLRVTPIIKKEKTILAAAVFMYGLLLIIPYIYDYNPEIVKDNKRVAAFIQEELPDTENILIYDRRVPSIQFLTDINIISLYDGGPTLNRELQFESDDSWKRNLKNLVEHPEQFPELIKPGNVLLVRANRELPEKYREDILKFNHKKSVDRWDIYYF